MRVPIQTEDVNLEKVSLCQLPGLSCFGCCGHHYTTENQIKEQIRKNTIKSNNSTDEEFVEYVKGKYLSAAGICRGVVRKNNKTFCPLHPALHKGRDLRIQTESCETDYMCKTHKQFDGWDAQKKKRFLEFIMSKNLDWFAYSMGMDSGKLLKEFEAVEKQ